MPRFIRLSLIFLVVPVIAFSAGRGIEWKLDSTLRSALLQKFPDEAADIAHASVVAWCSQPNVRNDSDAAEVCNLSDNMKLLKTGSIVAAALGLSLIVFIALAGKLNTAS